MLKYFLFICAVFLLVTPSRAQFYEDEYQEMLSPLDRAINQANDMFADFPIPGFREDAKPQDERYQNAIGPVNEANERHFRMGRDAKTIVERQEK